MGTPFRPSKDEPADSPRRACASMLGAHARQGLQPALQQIEKVHMVRPSRWKPRRLRSSRRCSATFGPASRSATAWMAWGGRKRANKLSWSLAEALRESDAKFVIDRAHCLWIARDARQGRLLFRLRAIGFHNQHLAVRELRHGSRQHRARRKPCPTAVPHRWS